MQSNPLLEKLCLADDDRAVILHVDDVGMYLTLSSPENVSSYISDKQ